jgi:hypothetical protein
MRLSLVLALAVSAGAVGSIVGCGSNSGDSNFNDPNAADPPNMLDGQPGFVPGDGSSGSSGSSGTSAASGDIDTASMRIDPANAVINVDAGQIATKAYRLFGKIKGTTNEIDLTSRAVFYVPDNYLVGGFPLNGGPTFSTRLPKVATDPAQRGGKLTVQAMAANASGTVTATTSLTVDLSAVLSGTASPALPASPASKFAGAVSAARAPVLAYPNNHTMLPPNLRTLEVHWMPGSASNTLYEISFKSALATITYYTRCGGGAGFQSGACAFLLDQDGYAYLAESNKGAGDVQLGIRATDDTGTGVGQSAIFDIQFSENTVNGGLYYWNVSATAIMRVDFGNPNSTPERYLAPGQDGMSGTCVGCHALSRDGTKLVASLGGQNDGRLVYIDDLTKAKTDPTWLTQGNGTAAASSTNKVQFASFNPSGSQFVAVYGDNPDSTSDRQKLWFADGNTGLRISSQQLTFKPDHPDWSPDGKTIAFTHVGDGTTTTQRPTDSSIDMITANGTSWNDPVNVVPEASGLNRYNPSFVPDSSFMYYSESSCAVGDVDGSGNRCDADADFSATTWVAPPKAAATPIHLANAAAPGVADGANIYLGDTFPRSAPFQTINNAGKLFWFTAASRRAVGLRTVGGAQHLWMFAVDPAKILAGQDGSFTGFYLPFQDFTTSNHIGQWTEKLVGATAPPPAPAPPPPPPPPAPPGVR